MDIEESSLTEYKEDDVGKFKTIVVFDCRGLEPIDYDPREGITVYASDGGEVFDNVGIEDFEWADYDEKNGNSCELSEFKSQFVKIKGK
jgi:hypothetical protein